MGERKFQEIMAGREASQSHFSPTIRESPSLGDRKPEDNLTFASYEAGRRNLEGVGEITPTSRSY